MIITVWVMNQPGTEYRDDLDPESFVDCKIRVDRKVVGHVTRVIELRPDGIHIEMEIEGQRIPWSLDKP